MSENIRPIDGFDLSLPDGDVVQEAPRYTSTLVPPNYIHTVWADVEPLLAGGADRTKGRWDIGNIYNSLISGEQQLWVTFNQDKDITNALTTELIEYPNKLSLAIQFAGGMKDQTSAFILDHMLTKLESYARDCGCHCLEFWGRKGFSRKLKQAGYEESLVFYEKDINYDQA
jgi:hypothetical protein|tara:strand:- start:5017 stop:5532 length:516 start_codon:yes stop_codon:yes gene_type:complete